MNTEKKERIAIIVAIVLMVVLISLTAVETFDRQPEPVIVEKPVGGVAEIEAMIIGQCLTLQLMLEHDRALGYDNLHMFPKGQKLCAIYGIEIGPEDKGKEKT